MPLVLNGATSGSTTIQATDAVTATLTLPSSTGTLISTANPQSGGVIQVVNVAYSTQTSTSSSTYSDTGLTATITPKFSTSKILVLVDMSIYKDTNNTNGFFKLVRSGSDLIVIDTFAGYNNSTNGSGIGSVSTNYLDSPATTSSTTYKIQFKSANNNAAIYINNNGYGTITSTMTLLEVAA